MQETQLHSFLKHGYTCFKNEKGAVYGALFVKIEYKKLSLDQAA